ncbi:hypothetical protein R3P38DRAFT_3184557 [Favolaschia claudopus]|uniref:Uncharacterized protein n=1 Tax=Favolaschia claudopus TaxID=2862362 RepID=A0AAW0C971_9AGAR
MLIALFIACSHVFISKSFRPDTGLDTYTSLTSTVLSQAGPLSRSSSHELSWTVLDLNRAPPPTRCCIHCNPTFLNWCRPSSSSDPRILKYSAEFIHPLPIPPSRPSSPASVISDTGTVASQQSNDFEPVRGKSSVSKEDKSSLRDLLIQWRKDRHIRMGNSPYVPCEVILPPKQLEKLVSSAGTFLKHSLVESHHIRKAVDWDMAAETDVNEVCDVISRWRLTLDIRRTPQSARRPRKRPQTGASPSITQPVFTVAPNTASPSRNSRESPRGTGRGYGRGRARGRGATPSSRPAAPPGTPIPTHLPSFEMPPSRYDDFFSTVASTRTFTPIPFRQPFTSQLAFSDLHTTPSSR